MNSNEPRWSLMGWYTPEDTDKALADSRKFLKLIGTLLGTKKRSGMAIVLFSPGKLDALLLPFLPPEGELRILGLTDKQAEKLKVFWGKRRTLTERSES